MKVSVGWKEKTGFLTAFDRKYRFVLSSNTAVPFSPIELSIQRRRERKSIVGSVE